MTRDELLDRLRRELTSGEWNDLRPDERLADVESRLDALVEEITALRQDYDEDSAVDLLRALDELAASSSYLRTDIGHLFSDATRLADELRAALRRAESGDQPSQIELGNPDSDPAPAESGGEPEQPGLFDS